jgi:signal transduction histidine kinase/ActR/RegA family two-component response regulator
MAASLERSGRGRAHRLIFRGNLLVRLIWIVVAAAAPALLVLVFLQLDIQASSETHAGKEALRQANTIQTDFGSITDAARELATSIAQSPDVQAHADSCQTLLDGFAAAMPRFGLFAVLDGAGQPICATPHDAMEVAAPRIRQQIGEAGPTRSFRVGNYLPAGPVAPDMLLFFQTFPAQGGDVTVALGLRLDWLDAHFQHWDRMPDSRILVADHRGTILVRVPDNGQRIGLSLMPESLVLQGNHEPGLAEVHDNIGMHRVAGYVPESLSGTGVFVLVTVSTDLVGQDFFASERRGLLVLGLGVAVALGATLVAGQRLIRRPARALMEAARAWARGDLGTRVNVDPGDGSEFGRISRALNDMAAAMQRQVTARQELQATLEARVAERTRDLLLSRDRLQVALGEQAKSEASLRQAQKMQMVGQLAGGIAHDFNNLLTALIGALDLLRPRLPGTDQRSIRLVDNAMQSAERGARLTSQLLAFSRRQRLLPVPTDLNHIIDGMMELLRTTIGRDIGVRTGLEANLRQALVDPNQLEAAILNLALNARDAMPKGGVLTLHTCQLHISTPQAAADGASELAKGDYVVVMVQDNGTGMAPEVLARVFEPFFTTKGPSRGSGLGLSQVHGLAAQSGGAVRISSQPGVGTTVSLILPAVHEAAQPGPRAQDGNSRRIMVVDDDAGVRALIGDMLVELGHRPILMSDPISALEQIEQAQHVDILLADYAMPGMNGADLITRARAIQSDLATILATGHADLPTLARGLADAELAKPFTFATLIQALDSALKRRAACNAEEQALS